MTRIITPQEFAELPPLLRQLLAIERNMVRCRNERTASIPRAELVDMTRNGRHVDLAVIVAFGAVVHWADFELWMAGQRANALHQVVVTEDYVLNLCIPKNAACEPNERILDVVKAYLVATYDMVASCPEAHRKMAPWLEEQWNSVDKGLGIMWAPMVLPSLISNASDKASHN